MTNTYPINQQTHIQFRLPPGVNVRLQCPQAEDSAARVGFSIDRDMREVNYMGWLIQRGGDVFSICGSDRYQDALTLRMVFQPPMDAELRLTESARAETHRISGCSAIEVSRGLIVAEAQSEPSVSDLTAPQPPVYQPPRAPAPPAYPQPSPAALRQDRAMFEEEFMRLDAAQARDAVERYRQAVRANADCAALLGMESVKGRLAMVNQELDHVSHQLRTLVEEREKTQRMIQRAVAYDMPLGEEATHG